MKEKGSSSRNTDSWYSLPDLAEVKGMFQICVQVVLQSAVNKPEPFAIMDCLETSFDFKTVQPLLVKCAN